MPYFPEIKKNKLLNAQRMRVYKMKFHVLRKVVDTP